MASQFGIRKCKLTIGFTLDISIVPNNFHGFETNLQLGGMVPSPKLKVALYHPLTLDICIIPERYFDET